MGKTLRTQTMMHSEKTSRDDSALEHTVGLFAAVSVLCLMTVVLFL